MLAGSVERLCLDAVRFPGDAELRATSIVPATLALVRERAPKEVTQAATLDFSTLVPAPGGLFDYKVFGPGTVIDAAELADDAVVPPRRTQFARIVLAVPLPHPLILDRCPGALRDAVGWTDAQLQAWLKGGNDVNLVDALEQSGHGELVVRELPVLPPDLRPLRRLDDDRWASSPVNDLYRRVLERNARIIKQLDSGGMTPATIGPDRQLLHRVLLQLFANELTLEPLLDAEQHPVMSLLGMCGGPAGIASSLHALDAHHAEPGAPLVGRTYKISSALFALGFDAQPRTAA